MSDAPSQPDRPPHLPNLVIKNFRGIYELTIPRLGRVTLLAGKNGVGKTTVLDAVRVWAYGGVSTVCDELLTQRGDASIVVEDGLRRVVADRAALFTNRPGPPNAIFSIGPSDEATMLYIRQATSSGRARGPYSSPTDTMENILLEVQFGEDSTWNVGSPPFGRFPGDEILCYTLGPNGATDETVEEYWNGVALTPYEDRALEALNLVTDAVVERVAALRPPISSGITQPRRMMAKVTGRDYQVPLRTLGDGAMRTYAVALALAKSSGGFLLIDEAENGIHHSIQAKFWNMVLQTAHRNNVQVIATTHSWDCVKGFAEASSELEDVEGALVRLERHEDRLRAVEYSERNLKAAAKYGIEVR